MPFFYEILSGGQGGRQEAASKKFQPAEASASGKVRGLGGEEWVDIKERRRD